MKHTQLQVLAALAAGTIFGFGLALSGMLDPVRVQGFLDVFGAWDPSLAFVLGGAVAVAMGGMAFIRRMSRPLLADSFHWPMDSRIDAPLVIGSAIFGLGWGLGGFCPGPAMASLSLGLTPTLVFVAFMLAGMIAHDRFFGRTS
ncbi:MAG: YeeE/YedE family protein [Mesorhizobium sp.]|uniref:YeeE/YedE family protein n=1 Tax=Mesorhizobium TaxID=68287 RepID=UPI000FCA7682|nr:MULTISPECIES: YeeE/YedE family protein [Mesorhizobium]MBN9219388.1 YeeE/YedE family protein [Mesorhizobium sp.]RUY33812.1 YeeE/YedE family protein [Mesorhizobium sp. M7A.F.Ca.US.001.04.1.1]